MTTTSETAVPEIGSPAPSFVLPDQDKNQVALSSLTDDRAALLVFYPFAFSGICTGELCAIRDDIGAFANDDVQVVGISCDPVHSLKAWAGAERYEFPLLSDFWPHGAVSRQYGVFLEATGFATRGTFLVDRDGILRWAQVNGPGEARDPDAYKAALAAL